MQPTRSPVKALAVLLLIAGVVSMVGTRPAEGTDSSAPKPRRTALTRDAASPAAARRSARFAGTSTCAPIISPSGNCSDLVFHGGPIMPSVQSYTIYWDPGSTIAAAYKTAVNTFYGDIGFGTFYDSVLQYSGSNGAPQDLATFAGTATDTTAYPSHAPGTPGSQANPLLDTDIRAAVLRAIAANPSWTAPGITVAYHVLLPQNVFVKDPSGTAESFVDFCAYHNDFTSGSNPVIYSTLPYAGTNLSGCGTGSPYPSGNGDIDSTISLASHELMEMVTDPLFFNGAWFDVHGNENGDLCAYVYGPRAGDGSNVTLNAHKYILQLEWSNAADINPPNFNYACVPHPPLPPPGGGGGGGGAPPPVTPRRIAGTDRIATAVLASQDVWPTKGTAITHASTAVIARSDDYPDALAGVPLAGTKRGPLLLTPQSGLDSGVANEVQRILPAGATVYVLGGTAALSPSVDGSLQQLGFQVVRLAGDDRYATAVAIATTGLNGPTTVLLATGTGFADALGAGAAAAHVNAAVLLTAGSTMPAATADYLSSHPGIQYAIGGPAAAADPSATGVAGADRYDTATLVAKKFFPNIANADIATGAAFPDALGGGAHAAFLSTPLLLTDPTTLPSSLATYLHGMRSTITSVVVFGGPAAVSDTVLSQISAALV